MGAIVNGSTSVVFPMENSCCWVLFFSKASSKCVHLDWLSGWRMDISADPPYRDSPRSLPLGPLGCLFGTMLLRLSAGAEAFVFKVLVLITFGKDLP